MDKLRLLPCTTPPYHIFGSVRRLARLAGFLSSLLMSSCNTVGSVESRAENINKMMATYASSAILYNVLRAANAEPLQFVSLATLTGHDTASASIGLPTIVIGAGQTPAQRLFLFGPNSISGSESNDFTNSAIDDPQSYAALLRPVDPATIGFFIAQGYTQGMVLFLFISRIRVYDAGNHLLHDYYEEPVPSLGLIDSCTNTPAKPSQSFNILNPCYKERFFLPLDTYINEGLTVKVDPTYVPQPNKQGNAIFCFDEKWIDTNNPIAHDTCSQTQLPKISTSAATAPQRVTHVNQLTIVMQTQTPTEAQPKPNFTFTDLQGHKVEIETRSVYGAYRFLGELAHVMETVPNVDSEKMEFLFTQPHSSQILVLTHDLTGCWTSVMYEGRHWCIPSDAILTKRVFALLHELYELYATPSTQPATQTVRVTP